MKPQVLISCPVGHRATDLLRVLCDVQILSNTGARAWSRAALSVLARDAVAMLVSPEDLVDEALLAQCRRLQVVATTARCLCHIDVAACTRRGIWVSSPARAAPGRHNLDDFDAAELDAARNIIDVLNRDTPRSAVNSVQPVATERGAQGAVATARVIDAQPVVHTHVCRHNGESRITVPVVPGNAGFNTGLGL